MSFLRLASCVVLAAAAFATGCTGPSSASKRTVNAYLAQRQYAQAESYLEANKESEYGKRNMVLYYLDKGLVQHHAGKYKESDASFDLGLVTTAETTEEDSRDLAIKRQRGERARAALEDLRPTEREALLLRYDSELSFREVAAACGCDEAAARKRVSRGLSRMRELLKDEL